MIVIVAIFWLDFIFTAATAESRDFCEPTTLGSIHQDVSQLTCLIKCEPFWKANPESRPPSDSEAYCRPMSYIVKDLFTRHSAKECLEGAWQGLLSFADQLRAYALLAKSIGASIRSEILEHKAFVEGCRKDVPCRRALGRMLGSYQARQANGEYVISDAELDHDLLKADFNALAIRLATERENERRRCESQLAQLQSAWNQSGLDGEALAQKRFEVVSLREPQCAGVLGLTPVSQILDERQTQCLDRSNAVKSACLEAVKFVADPIVVLPVVGASAKALLAGKSLMKATTSNLIGAAIKPKIPLRQLLPSLAKPFDEAFKVPGYLSGQIAREKGARFFLLTEDIPESSLPYKNGLRPVRPSRHEKFSSVTAVPMIDVDESSVHLTSRFGGGSQKSDVRLGFLKDGTPVVLKTYNDQSKILGEAASAEFLSAQGVGPRFHGLYRGSRGELNVVMDVVPGDHLTMRRQGLDGSANQPNVTAKTLTEADEIFRRLKVAGIKSLQEFQLYLTPSGHPSAIDPDRIIEALASKSVDSEGRDWAGFTFEDYVHSTRLKMLRLAPTKIQQDYLTELGKSSSIEAERLRIELSKSP